MSIALNICLFTSQTNLELNFVFYRLEQLRNARRMKLAWIVWTFQRKYFTQRGIQKKTLLRLRLLIISFCSRKKLNFINARFFVFTDHASFLTKYGRTTISILPLCMYLWNQCEFILLKVQEYKTLK